MSGTRAGGLKAAATNRAKYGDNFYRKIGQSGGKNGNTGGFAANPALARLAGSKGGKRSLRSVSLEKLKAGQIPPSTKTFIEVYIARMPRLFATLLEGRKPEFKRDDIDTKMPYQALEKVLDGDASTVYARLKVITAYTLYLREVGRQKGNQQVLSAVVAINSMVRDIIKKRQAGGLEVNIPTPSSADNYMSLHYSVFQKIG